ncbi:MAG: GNAT family N-acetyltransferase [Candidatus Pelagibacter bacterium]|nr:GNAT family N-acetyltransferase [Candidatus Pelagibacter bacterium]MBL6863043.1 GNAT family N-acetyltransferase [Candidatus Pelagibacter bacterium]MDA7750923.1 GNAT family N-acetyltransferase [Candidatus Pelagibacter sp.]MDA9615650.1 GNAT family N-acetyltransferase [Candidatus Pelagibacter sp.]MDB9745004.1 GNAT family N-acetyltransferase [Candidatus Pelagibacter sp.]
MTEKIFRNYLEIKSLEDFKEVEAPSQYSFVELLNPKDFQLNKFFYKNVGKNHRWIDRLIWTDLNWIEYVSNKKLFTYVLKEKNEIAGYYELLFYENNKEAEIAYFGILEEYFGKKLGGYLLSEAIKNSFNQGAKRVWVHTCSLDHENALKNYLARGMKVFKTETLIR